MDSNTSSIVFSGDDARRTSTTGRHNNKRRRSDAWEVFLPIPGQEGTALCMICDKKCSNKDGTTSHLLRHPCFKTYKSLKELLLQKGPVVEQEQAGIANPDAQAGGTASG